MKILWSVNTLMPQVAKRIGVVSGHSISWVDAMSKLLAKNEEVVLAIASIAKVKTLQAYDIDNVRYYIIPNNKIEESWDELLCQFAPDVIHLYGTERSHNIPLIKKNPSAPIIISLQGILKGYEKCYYGGIDVSTIFKNITLRDIARGTIFKERKRFQKGAEREEWMLRHVKYVEGRSTWDRVYSETINPDLKYFHCPRLIRAPFYEAKWSLDHVERHTIFIHQGNYPIKGLHFLFEAMPTLMKKYPDLRLYIAGEDFFNKQTIKEKLLINGYTKYLQGLYKKYSLEKYICFLGRMTAEEVAERLSKVHVMVIPSVIENAPNSLAEAMLVGTPSVASYVGGNPEMLNDGECGMLYCYNEPLMMADCIDKLFSSEELSIQFSKKAREVARVRHNPEYLEKTLLSIYRTIV